MAKVFLSYGSDIDPSVLDTVRRALRGRNDLLLTSHEEPVESRMEKLFSADVAVVFLGNEIWNAAFELGLATARGVPAVIVTRSASSLPTDLAGTLFVPWTDDSSEFVSRLLPAIASATRHRAHSSKPGSLLRWPEEPNAERNADEVAGAAGVAAVLSDLPLSPSGADFSYSEDTLGRQIAAALMREGWIVRPEAQRDIGADLVVHHADQGITVIQVKSYSPLSQVGLPEVRRLIASGSIAGAQQCVFVSTTDFSPSAVRYAQEAPIETLLYTIVDPHRERLADLEAESRTAG